MPVRRLAEVLGKLNFASKAVPGGAFFMARMWDRFRGVVIDWGRGVVRIIDGVRDVKVDSEMWKDLEWWQVMLSQVTGIPLVDDESHRWLVRSGTDGSDWGSGQFVILHGEKEELQCCWTSDEVKKPINWREMNGALRILREWGPRMRGCVLWMAVDNLVSVNLLQHFRVTAPELAELMRRIYRLCAKFSIKLKVQHVAGVDLILPDTMSRELCAMEPRQRLTLREFNRVVFFTGRPTSYLGRERDHVDVATLDALRSEVESGSRSRVDWFNPQYNQTALFLKSMRGMAASIPGYIGVMLVPHRPDCRWWNLTNGLSLLNVWEEGSECIEEWRGGEWCPLSSKYRLALFSTAPLSDYAKVAAASKIDEQLSKLSILPKLNSNHATAAKQVLSKKIILCTMDPDRTNAQAKTSWEMCGRLLRPNKHALTLSESV